MCTCWSGRKTIHWFLWRYLIQKLDDMHVHWFLTAHFKYQFFHWWISLLHILKFLNILYFLKNLSDYYTTLESQIFLMWWHLGQRMWNGLVWYLYGSMANTCKIVRQTMQLLFISVDLFPICFSKFFLKKASYFSYSSYSSYSSYFRVQWHLKR